MVNAPAVNSTPDAAPWAQRVHERLVDARRIEPEDNVVWERTPRMLETRFPDTRGAIYGASSNSPLAAFRRPPNTLPAIPGLHLAGGSAHPGGGVPLCLQSGHRAATEAIHAMGLQRSR